MSLSRELFPNANLPSSRGGRQRTPSDPDCSCSGNLRIGLPQSGPMMAQERSAKRGALLLRALFYSSGFCLQPQLYKPADCLGSRRDSVRFRPLRDLIDQVVGHTDPIERLSASRGASRFTGCGTCSCFTFNVY